VNLFKIPLVVLLVSSKLNGHTFVRYSAVNLQDSEVEIDVPMSNLRFPKPSHK
jgi:hypothetical protein